MATTKRRLHIWEHPSLHPDQQKARALSPVHIVFEENEYDWYLANSGQNLMVGDYIWVEPTEINPDGYWKNVPFYYVAPGMYAKVWEEVYVVPDPEPEPEETPLFDLASIDVGEGHVGRERFEKQDLTGTLAVPAGYATDEAPEVNDHTIVLPSQPDRIDADTGLNLTHIQNQVIPPPPKAPLLDLGATRLDLQSPLMLMPLVEPAKKEEQKDSEPE